MKNLELKTKLKEYDAMERKVEQLEGMESKLKEDKQKMKLQLQKHVKWKKFWKSTAAILAGDVVALCCQFHLKERNLKSKNYVPN